MIIDCFTFYNELDILEFRLQTLWSLVDKFVIVEADHSFSGKKKPFYFDHERFSWAKDKIVLHSVSVPESILPNPDVKLPYKYDPKHMCWNIEIFQRNAIKKAVEELSVPDDSIVLIGDVDEIPSREALKYAIDINACEDSPVVFRQSMFYYNLKFLRKEMWHGTIMTTAKELMHIGPQSLRDQRNSLPKAIANGGWHLSFFGGRERIRNKVESFSHQELNKEEFKNDQHIAHCIETGEDLFDRDIPVMTVKREQFPKYFQDFSNQEWW